MDAAMTPPKININLATKISADLRAAKAEYRALDRCGFPVLTADRETLLARIEALQAEEHRVWGAYAYASPKVG